MDLDLRAPRLDMSVPELIWLSKIEKTTDTEDTHVDHMTWCERRLWEKGCLRRFEWRPDRDPRSVVEFEISDIGRETLEFHRERWKRKQEAPAR